jgi:predicted Zn-dependent protease
LRNKRHLPKINAREEAMKTEYRRLMEVIKGEINHAISTDCLIEGPEGSDIRQKISNISIHFFERTTRECVFENSILESDLNDKKVDLLVRIFKENEHKIIRTDFGYTDFPVTPDGFKIFFRQNLDTMIRTSMDLFYVYKKKQSKHFVVSSDMVEVYGEEISGAEAISKKVQKLIADFSRMVYRIPFVIETECDLELIREVNMIADSEGREIIQHKNIVSCTFITRCLNSQRFEIRIPTVFHCESQQELIKNFKKHADSHLDHIMKCEQVSMIESGYYPMLLSPEATSVMFHEAILGHLLSGRLIVDNHTTVFKNKMGYNLADMKGLSLKPLRGIKITIDPQASDKFGSYRYDNEGIRAKKFVILDRGVIKSFLLSRNSAARMKTKSNGHARAGCYVNENGDVLNPEPRISHYDITPYKAKSNKELQKEIEDFCRKHHFDFYLKINCFGGNVEVETGLFTMNLGVCEKVFLDGRIETMIGGTISGSPYDLLSCIKSFGSSKECVNAFCGAHSGWIPVSAEVPRVFFCGNYVSGKDPEPRLDFDFLRNKIIPEGF